MPTITLRFKDVKIKEYQIVVGQTCTIGRKHSNDIVIDHPTVSGSHALIESLSTAFILRDLGSTNGTYINNEKITLHHLRHNDEIIIGNHKLVFDLSDIMKGKPAIVDDYEVDKTRIFTPSAARGQQAGSSVSPSAAGGEEATGSWWQRLWGKIFG